MHMTRLAPELSATSKLVRICTKERHWWLKKDVVADRSMRGRCAQDAMMAMAMKVCEKLQTLTFHPFLCPGALNPKPLSPLVLRVGFSYCGFLVLTNVGSVYW